MLRAATMAGVSGVLLLLVCGLAVLWAGWNIFKRRPQNVLEAAVVAVYMVSAFYLDGVWLIIRNLRYTSAACFCSALLWWNSYERLDLLLVLVSIIGAVVVTAVVTRPRHVRLKNPGCFPGAIMALLGAIIVDLFLLATVFGNLYYREGQERRDQDEHRRLERKEQLAPTVGASGLPAAQP